MNPFGLGIAFIGLGLTMVGFSIAVWGGFIAMKMPEAKTFWSVMLYNEKGPLK